MVLEYARPGDPPPDFSAADCRIHTVRAGVYPCAVVEMPPPHAMTEAYFTAAVLLLDPTQGQLDLATAAVRYFTLELGFSLDNVPQTVLCEWGKDGAHINYGEGPTSDVEAFMAAVCRLLNPEDNWCKP